ncbi:hypothetical protein Hanom_Chr05g00437761 [Helianthus anomalus]
MSDDRGARLSRAWRMRIGSFGLPFVPFVLLRCLYATSLRERCCAWYWHAQALGGLTSGC